MAAIDEKEGFSDDCREELFVESPENIAAFASPEQIQSEVSDIISSAESAKQAGDIDSDDHLVIFVHGYNNNDDFVAQRAVKIDKMYGSKSVITSTFNWKSECKKLKYFSDQFTVLMVEQSFARYIELIRMHNKFKRIDIICHSMGNFVLCQTILHYCVFHKKLDIFKGFNIICLAADVETEQYNRTIQAVKDIISSWCHYWCAKDGPLNKSGWVNGNKRAGLSKCGMRHLSVVHDIEWKQWKRFEDNHAYIDDVVGDRALANDILGRLRAKQPTVGNYDGGHVQLKQECKSMFIGGVLSGPVGAVIGAPIGAVHGAVAAVVSGRITQSTHKRQVKIVGANIEKNQPFILRLGNRGYVGCNKSGWLTATKVMSDAILFEFELSSVKYKYTHYKVKKCAYGKYNGYYISYSGSSWCAGLYPQKKDALCIEYRLAEKTVVSRGTENRMAPKARELRFPLKSNNHYMYFRNDYKVCRVTHVFSHN